MCPWLQRREPGAGPRPAVMCKGSVGHQFMQAAKAAGGVEFVRWRPALRHESECAIHPRVALMPIRVRTSTACRAKKPPFCSPCTCMNRHAVAVACRFEGNLYLRGNKLAARALANSPGVSPFAEACSTFWCVRLVPCAERTLIVSAASDMDRRCSGPGLCVRVRNASSVTWTARGSCMEPDNAASALARGARALSCNRARMTSHVNCESELPGFPDTFVLHCCLNGAN